MSAAIPNQAAIQAAQLGGFLTSFLLADSFFLCKTCRCCFDFCLICPDALHLK
jgi:hypothetical protein